MDAFVKRLPQAEKDDDGSRPLRNQEPPSERPRKRLKGEEVAGSASEGSEESSSEDGTTRNNGPGGNTSDDEQHRRRNRTTDVENVLPPTQTDDSAIEEYELMKSSQKSTDEDGTTAKTRPLWIKGKSSIYLDAFNLALDTVLEEESQLFDEKEMEVFRQWRGLNYEAQYL